MNGAKRTTSSSASGLTSIKLVERHFDEKPDPPACILAGQSEAGVGSFVVDPDEGGCRASAVIDPARWYFYAAYLHR